ncbi:MAG: gamma-glutamyl-gamma-aminobutyrate hydrolase family protein [Gammaproteobacteria bacterium]
MIVAVSMRVVEAVGYSERRDATSHDLVRFLVHMGGTPLLIPNAPDTEAYLARFKFDRLVLSGGEDIASDITGSVARITNLRDRTERRLLDAATARGLPVLGICRGAMFLNQYLGGGLTHDLESVIGEEHVAKPHEIHLWNGRTAVTNSFHRHGILLRQLAPELRQLAVTQGGTVEAFRSQSGRLLGLMWHPERLGSASEVDRELMGAWLK